jgi:hypothetical protein
MPPLSWFTLLSFALTAIAAALLAAAIFARRIISSRTPRCPTCKYSLTSVPHTHDDLPTCPECGRRATSLIELHTLTPRKRLVAAAAVLFVGAFAAHLTPAIKTQGWFAALPMSIQITSWSAGDQNLHERIMRAHLKDELSESHRRALTREIMDHFTNTPSPKPFSITPYLRATTKPPLIAGDNLATLLRSTDGNLRTYIVMSAKHAVGPVTNNVAQARRDIAWNPETHQHEKIAIQWIIEHPDLPGDAALLRDVITKTTETAFWDIHDHFDRAPPQLIPEILPLLDEPDPIIRTRALLILEQWQREIDKHPAIETQIAAYLVTLVQDPDPRVQREAINLIEHLSVTSYPQLQQILTTTTDPTTLTDILARLRRINRPPPEILPALEAIIADESRPLATRLRTANAHKHIQARARTHRPPILIYPVYDALIRALERNDLDTFSDFNSIISADTPDLHFTQALQRRLTALGIPASDTQTYLDTHPLIAAALETWRPSMNLPDSAPTSQILDTLAPTNTP